MHVDPSDPTRLLLHGEVDVAVVGAFADTAGLPLGDLGRSLGEGGVTEVDLSAATFIDSSAIALLVAIAPALRPGRLRVRGAQGSPLMAIRATGLDALFDLVPAD